MNLYNNFISHHGKDTANRRGKKYKPK